ncbi:hypothetical protein [Subtercola sp. YIM 133946]|uniref:hypothetical protein n=1 Tax=Subtercola sp. YIM 133946 TaxID=3118909 RepID=UPI002F93611A
MSGPITDIEALVESIDIDGIEVYEIVARGVAREDEGFEDRSAISGAVRHERGFLWIRFVYKFEATAGEYSVDIAARYVLSQETHIDQAVIIEFAERVAFMTVYPFIRETVFSMASRLGHPAPILGLVKQGDFSLQQGEDPRDLSADEPSA